MIPTNYSIDDPLSQIYVSLADMVINHKRLPELVRPGNIVIFRDRWESVKPVLSDADLPEIILVPEGAIGNLHHTSSTSDLTQSYAWYVTVQDQRLTHQLFPIQWLLWSALADWKNHVGRLRWKDAQFAKQINIGSCEIRHWVRDHAKVNWGFSLTITARITVATRLLSEA